MDEPLKRLRMSELARSFPAMRQKCIGVDQAAAHGIDPWNATRLHLCSQPWSPSEKLVVAFLLEVWNQHELPPAPFRVVEALSRWDKGNWAAFWAWASNPFYC